MRRPRGIRSLMPAMSAGVVIFFLGFRPTWRVPKNVGPRILIFSWSSASFFICGAEGALEESASTWLASRNVYADVRTDHAGPSAC